MNYGFGILAAVGVAAWIIKDLANAENEKEQHRIKVLKWRREAMFDAHEIDIRREAKQYLQKLVAIAEKDRQDIYEKLGPLRVARAKIRENLFSGNKIDRRNLRLAIWRFDDIIEEKYAGTHLNTLFIDEARRRIEKIYEHSASERSAKWARRLDYTKYIEVINIPAKGSVVQGIVHYSSNKKLLSDIDLLTSGMPLMPLWYYSSSPSGKSLWFQLDASIRGDLLNEEKEPKLISGQKINLFIERINYHDYSADVSICKAKFLHAWNKGMRKRKATVVNQTPHGFNIDISGVKAFIPASLAQGLSKTKKDILVELIEVEPKLRSIVAKPILG